MASEDVTIQDCHDSNAPPILSMPIEIISRISFQLNTTDLCNFRLTCRGIENCIYNDFAEEFFSRKQFMVSEFSLKALCDIAKSRLGWHLKQFHLGLETMVLDPSLSPSGLTEHHQRRCQDYVAEQHWLWSAGRVQDLLTEAFRHLPNLDTVVIRDFNSLTRYRDGPQEQWQSYGASTMRENCGMPGAVRLAWSSDTPGPSEHVSRVFAAVLVSLARADARPKSLKVYERKGHRLQDSALHIPLALQENIAPVLGGLRELHLCIQPLSVMLSKKAINNYFLRNFLALVPNLLELRINGLRHSVIELGRDSLKSFQQWLAAPPPVPASNSVTSAPHNSQDEEWWEMLPPPVTFPKLRTLSLGCMSATVRDLLAIITKFAPSITRLELWTITLSPEPTSSDPFVENGKQCLWQQFFRGLIQIQGLELREIFIGRLRQHNSSIDGRENEVQFVQENADRAFDQHITFDKQFDFHGRAWRQYVAGLSMIFSRDSGIFRKNGIRGSVGKDDNEEKAKQIRETFIHRVRLGGSTNT